MCEPRCRSDLVCPVCASVCQCNEPTTVPHLYSHDHVKDFSLDCFLLLVMVQRFFFFCLSAPTRRQLRTSNVCFCSKGCQPCEPGTLRLESLPSFFYCRLYAVVECWYAFAFNSLALLRVDYYYRLHKPYSIRLCDVMKRLCILYSHGRTLGCWHG